jgi:TatD DNase family protein
MGFYIAFGAYIGYPSSKMADVINTVPLERLPVETDSPFLPPQAHRGKCIEPAYITVPVGVLAQIRKTSFEEIVKQATNNARQLFRIRS